MNIRDKRFELTEAHIKLMRRMHVRWHDYEFGAPGVDAKRPYGNSSVYWDMLDILGETPECVVRIAGIEYTPGSYDFDLPKEVEERLMKLHKETQWALGILLNHGSIEPGQYVSPDGFGLTWEKEAR
jgi:hypothetical protein